MAFSLRSLFGLVTAAALIAAAGQFGVVPLVYAAAVAGSLIGSFIGYYRYDKTTCGCTTLGGCIGATVSMVFGLVGVMLHSLLVDYFRTVDPNEIAFQRYELQIGVIGALILITFLYLIPSSVLGTTLGFCTWLSLRDYEDPPVL